MLSSNSFGLGNLRPYFTVAILALIFVFGKTTEVSAQIDIDIDILRMPSMPAGDPIAVAPNPVVSYAQVKHDSGLQMQSLTIISQYGEVLAVLNINQSTSFQVSLPAGLSHWVFQTDEGVISKQVVISGP
jgi:hypothetical protein